MSVLFVTRVWRRTRDDDWLRFSSTATTVATACENPIDSTVRTSEGFCCFGTHDLEFGQFEGTIPQGQYGAGRVKVWDHGTYELEEWTNDRIAFMLTARA